MSIFSAPIINQELSGFNQQAYLLTDLSGGNEAIKSYIEGNPETEITVVSSISSAELEEFLAAYENVSLTYDELESSELENVDRVAFAVFNYTDFETLEKYAVELRIPIDHLSAEAPRVYSIAA